MTIYTHFFNVSTKLYEVLNILTSYENTKLTRSTIKSWKRLIITGLLYKATTVYCRIATSRVCLCDPVIFDKQIWPKAVENCAHSKYACTVFPQIMSSLIYCPPLNSIPHFSQNRGDIKYICRDCATGNHLLIKLFWLKIKF